MSARINRTFAVLSLVFFLSSCGDLGMVLPSQGSYRVNAQVDDDYTLDAYSVIGKNSRIRPYFVNSVVNDPDVRGITVFVQDYSGEAVSRKVRYLLAEEERRPAQPELPVEPPPDSTEEATLPVDGSPAGASPAGGSSVEGSPAGGSPAGGVPSEGASGADETGAPNPGEAPDQETPDNPPAGGLDAGTAEAPADGGIGDSRPGEAVETPGGAGLAAGPAGNYGPADNEPADRNYPGQAPVNADHGSGGSYGSDASGGDAQGGDIRDTNTLDEDGHDSNAGGTDLAAGDAAGRDAEDRNSAYSDTVITGDAGTNTADRDAAGADAASGDSAETGVVAGTEPGGGADRDAPETGSGADSSGALAQGNDAQGNDAKGNDAKGIVVQDSIVRDRDTANTGGGNRDAAGSDVAKTDSAAETPVPPAFPVDIPRAPLPEDETVLVKQLDQYFPEFRIIEDLAIGRYNMVFQVMGEKEILYKAVKPIYFIGDAKFSLGEIQSFLPVEITGRRLIPPGINVMLATEVSADPRLDPYIIWHSGKKIVAQGRLSEGANSLFWKTPEQTGFHSVRVEVFPLLPGDRMPGNMIGKIKELSMPVSARSEGIRHLNDSSGGSGGEFIAWYQFWGTLDDSKAPNSPGRKLIPLYAQAPRWMPLGGIYGLLVGRDDGYTLPGTPFTLSGDEEGRGRILFHLGALSQGPVLNLRFAGGAAAEGGETAELDLSFAADALILRIASKDAFREKSLAINSDDAKGFFTVIVDFTIAPDHFDAELIREEPPGTTGPLSITLNGAVSGEGSVRFGGHPGQGGTRPASGVSGRDGTGTMSLNELAFSYARTPLPSGGGPFESDLPEIPQEETYPDAEPEPPSPNAL
jgi:hypothetical protein